MKSDAELLLKKLDLPYEGLSPLKGQEEGKNSSWRVEGTEFMLRVAPENVTGDSVLVPLQAAVHLQQAGLHFVTPAYPTVLSQVTGDGRRVNGGLWFYEETVSKRLDYRQLGQIVRQLQTTGTDAIRAAGLMLPQALDIEELRRDLELLKGWQAVTKEEYSLLAGWLPRIERGAARLPKAPDVLVHDDLWPKNLIMTEHRGLVLCDPDNLSWGRPEYDLAFIARALQQKLISRGQVEAFEQGYGGKIPDVTTAWRLALFHRFRWLCRLLERRDTDETAAAKVKAELPLWRRRRGPQPS
jgi:aminoglycoside phosphotransferase (APT) family kinase protein